MTGHQPMRPGVNCEGTVLELQPQFWSPNAEWEGALHCQDTLWMSTLMIFPIAMAGHTQHISDSLRVGKRLNKQSPLQSPVEAD